jgi:hypothetical protein
MQKSVLFRLRAIGAGPAIPSHMACHDGFKMFKAVYLRRQLEKEDAGA